MCVWRGVFWLVVLSSVDVAEVADLLVLHQAQVVHGAAEGDLDGFADAGGAAFHQLDLVDGFVDAKRNHLGPGKPLPGDPNAHSYFFFFLHQITFAAMTECLRIFNL